MLLFPLLFPLLLSLPATKSGSAALPMRLTAAKAAAMRIQAEWREHQLTVRAAALRRLHEERDEKRRLIELQNEADVERRLQGRRLHGALYRVWPIVREAMAVMMTAVAVALVAPEAFYALPVPFDVDPSAPAAQQARAALLGACVAVAAFASLFVALILLFVYRCTVLLYSLHSLWIASLLGAPLALFIRRLCEAACWPLDGVTLVLLTWNATVPGLVLVHWSATAIRFERARRMCAGALSVLMAWLLASAPYQTAIATLLLLAVLDVILVSFPGSPVQHLDAIASRRRLAGEKEMPGLTFKHGGLELGLGDFIVYSAFAAHAVRNGIAPLAAVAAGVFAGLAVTMAHVALASRRTVVPALPLSVALGAVALAVERMVAPMTGALAWQGVVL